MSRWDVETEAVLAFLRRCLDECLGAEAQRWLADRPGEERGFIRTFALLPRITGKATVDLQQGPACVRALHSLRLDQIARLWLLLASSDDAAQLAQRVERLFSAADLDEQVTLYRGLALYPDGARFAARAAEGVRSNMTPVFAAVALDNLYPSRFLPEPAFNQLVVKALHVEAPLARILGLDARMNPRLIAMLQGYVAERRAAGRQVDPALFDTLLEAN